MAQTHEVLGMLIPDGGYVAVGDEYEGIEFTDCKAITKKQFLDGFAQFDAYKAKQKTDKDAAKIAAQAKLAALGLTVEDLTALGL